ncbi:hypothetical protein [Streptomyces davaonensis]|uniref:hypothetical protein n=1 Tax=Streptomyces davaonensis TaxID=348043 RepID=UPI000344B7DF|nr:hypothetical protein [Streptomyces davaonensis]
MLATLGPAVLAIIATLLGAIVSGRFQERAAERSVRVSHGESIRRDRLEAVTALACAASDHRRALWMRGDAVLKNTDDVGMKPAHYAVHVEARRKDNTGRILLRLGPYTQTWLASRDAERLNTLLEGRATTVMPGYTVTAKDTAFHVSDHASYSDPHEADACELLAALLKDVSAPW